MDEVQINKRMTNIWVLICSEQVVFYKRLHKVYFVPAIPKSPTGKILRKELRAKLASIIIQRT